MTDLCPHCDREWHGLAITERMEEMRAEYQREQWRRNFLEDGEPEYATSAILDDYRYRDDHSPILCPGSLFIGPRAPIDAEAEQARKELLITTDDSPWVILTPRLGSAYIEITPDMDPTFDDDGFSITLRQTDVLAEFFRGFEEVVTSVGESFRHLETTLTQFAADIDDALTPQQRALPRPTSTPPMWAHQPNRRRRERSQR